MTETATPSNRPQRARTARQAAGLLVHHLLPGATALLVLSLISQHMAYYGLGVNPGANNGYLMYFVAPPLLAGLYAASALARWLLQRWLGRPMLARCGAGLCVVVLGLGCFALHDGRTADEPLERPHDTVQFLRFYLAQLSRPPR